MRESKVWRVRWAAVGAALAVAVGAGGGIAITNAAVSSGERDVFVPITPCRLMDTRAATQVGPRATPIGAGETYTQVVRGTNGNCTISADAIAVAMNVTVVDGTAGSFLTVWPSDAAKPLASSLNWQAGQAATPNKVDVRLSADGKVSFFNLGGTVNVIADVVGYYADHNFDDRYLPKNGSVEFGHPAFTAGAGGAGVVFANGCIRSGNANALEASVSLPIGVKVTGFKAEVRDDDAAGNLTLDLLKVSNLVPTIASVSTTGVPGLTTVTATLAVPEVVDSGEYFFMRFTPTAAFTLVAVCGVEIQYTAP
ncbi:MAG TPA: hypothetical protein VHN36_10480 [Ilumatobacteraceae bacterium]|nr:hypothetical protein [Ilumatobacteraceae bacterium]